MDTDLFNELNDNLILAKAAIKSHSNLIVWQRDRIIELENELKELQFFLINGYFTGPKKQKILEWFEGRVGDHLTNEHYQKLHQLRG